MAQGNGRAQPDGFLHLNNWCHVKGSGLAGVLYERVMTTRQQDLVERTLIEIAAGSDPTAYHYKHEVTRFSKGFLTQFFKGAVYSVYRAIRRTPASEMSTAIAREELTVESVKLAR